MAKKKATRSNYKLDFPRPATAILTWRRFCSTARRWIIRPLLSTKRGREWPLGSRCTPGTASIVYQPVKPPPVVDFLQPRENIAVDSATLKVRFRVRSASALSKVQLLQEDGKPAAVDLAKLQPQQDGSYESTTEMDI